MSAFLKFINSLKASLVAAVGAVLCIGLLVLSTHLFFKLGATERKLTETAAKLERSERNLATSQANVVTLNAALDRANKAQADMERAEEAKLTAAQAATDAAVRRGDAQVAALQKILDHKRPAGVSDGAAANGLIDDALNAEVK